jgi:hypothetical protein
MLIRRLILIVSLGMLFSASLEIIQVILSVVSWLIYPVFNPSLPPSPLPYVFSRGFATLFPEILLYLTGGIIGLRLSKLLLPQKLDSVALVTGNRLGLIGTLGVITILSALLNFIGYSLVFLSLNTWEHSPITTALAFLGAISDSILILWVGAIALGIRKYVLFNRDQANKSQEF